MNTLLSLRSHLTHRLITKKLWKGVILSLIGLFGLLYAGTFIPANALKYWGLPIYLICFTLITIGLLPYRQLIRLQIKPNEIRVSSTGIFSYYEKGKCLFSFPYESIKKTVYKENGDVYGIGIDLNEEELERLRLSHATKRCDCDIFLPFFSKRSYDELQSLSIE